MIARTLSIIAANWWFYLFFVVVLLILFALADAGYIKSATGITVSILWLLFARFVHRAALFNVKFGALNADGTPDRSYLGFMLKGLALFVISTLLAFPFLIFPIGAEHLTETQAPELSDVLPFGLALIIIYAVVLSFAGSWLPATVYGKNTGLSAALQRGRSNFFQVLPWIGIALLVAIALELLIFAPQSVLGIDPAIVRNGTFNFGGAVFQIVRALIEAVCVTLISVILSQYYLDYETGGRAA